MLYRKNSLFYTEFFYQLAYLIRDQTNQRPLRTTHGCQKKTAVKKCQIQNNLAPALQYFVIDWNSNSDQNERKQWSKQRQKRAKIIIQTPTETNENNNPKSDRNDWKDNKGINVHTNETYGYLCCLSAREHFFHIRNKA